VSATGEDPQADVELRARFDDEAELARWAAVDDVVMGGASTSGLHASGQGSALFTGVVSLAHGGGFASVRSRPRDWELAGARGIALRVRGDGKTYKLNVRTDEDLDGVSWQAAFTPRAGEWQTVHVRFDALEPRRRGRPVPAAGALRPADVRTRGLLIGDAQAGPFQLELEGLGAGR
jgi:hypothetical protein